MKSSTNNNFMLNLTRVSSKYYTTHTILSSIWPHTFRRKQ